RLMAVSRPKNNSSSSGPKYDRPGYGQGGTPPTASCAGVDSVEGKLIKRAVPMLTVSALPTPCIRPPVIFVWTPLSATDLSVTADYYLRGAVKVCEPILTVPAAATPC